MQVELVDIVDRLSDVGNEGLHDLSAVLGGTDDQRHGVCCATRFLRNTDTKIEKNISDS